MSDEWYKKNDYKIKLKDNYCKNNNIKLYRIKYNEDVNNRMEEKINELFCQ